MGKRGEILAGDPFDGQAPFGCLASKAGRGDGPVRERDPGCFGEPDGGVACESALIGWHGQCKASYEGPHELTHIRVHME
jgi:hypothetical protein